MGLVSFRPYRESSAIIVGFGFGLLLCVVWSPACYGLCLGVGLGAVMDGVMRIRGATASLSR